MDPKVRKNVEEFLKGVQQIPTLPDVYLKVKKAFEDPNISVEYLADAIRYDQALTVSILRLANSPLFGFRQKISSINQAIMLIGLREVYSLVLSVTVMGLFPMTDDENSLFPARKFWEHSLAVAIASRMLGTSMGYQSPDELFVAGLIHDIGKMIEKMYLGEKFERICRRARDEKRFFLDIEADELGFTHAEVGGILTETWKFPAFLISTTAHHHQPAKVSDPEFMDGAAVVHLADSLVRGLGIGWSGDPYVTPVDMNTLKRLHLIPFNDMKVIISNIKKDFDIAVASMMAS